jgi:hypothetical protein
MNRDHRRELGIGEATARAWAMSRDDSDLRGATTARRLEGDDEFSVNKIGTGAGSTGAGAAAGHGAMDSSLLVLVVELWVRERLSLVSGR